MCSPQSMVIGTERFLPTDTSIMPFCDSRDTGEDDITEIGIMFDVNVLVVNESTANISTVTGFHTENSVTLRIGDELIEFSGVTKSAPFKISKSMPFSAHFSK